MIDQRTPPLKIEALHVLASGPMTFTPDIGWRGPSSRHVFNSHTIAWIVSQGWARYSVDRQKLFITNDGAEMQEAA